MNLRQLYIIFISNQNLICGCLLFSVFYPILPEFRTILGSDQVNSGKNRVKHINQQTVYVKFFINIKKNMELCHIYLVVSRKILGV